MVSTGAIVALCRCYYRGSALATAGSGLHVLVYGHCAARCVPDLGRTWALIEHQQRALRCCGVVLLQGPGACSVCGPHAQTLPLCADLPPLAWAKTGAIHTLPGVSSVLSVKCDISIFRGFACVSCRCSVTALGYSGHCRLLLQPAC